MKLKAKKTRGKIVLTCWRRWRWRWCWRRQRQHRHRCHRCCYFPFGKTRWKRMKMTRKFIIQKLNYIVKCFHIRDGIFFLNDHFRFCTNESHSKIPKENKTWFMLFTYISSPNFPLSKIKNNGQIFTPSVVRLNVKQSV